MSSSIHNGFVLFASSLYGAADDPADTAILRDGVANGLLHGSDAAGMVRVNAHARASVGGFTPDPDVPTSGQWYLLQGSPLGSWPLTMRGNGTPWRMRIRVGGYGADGGGATITVRVVIAPSLAEALAGRFAEEDNVFECVSVATTPTWFTGTSQGAVGGATYVSITPEQAATWTRIVPTFDAVSGASPATVDQVLVSAWVFGKTTTDVDYPIVSALHLSEVLAP